MRLSRLQRKGHAILRLYAQSKQAVRQRIGASVKLSEAERRVRRNQGRSIRRMTCPPFQRADAVRRQALREAEG